MFWLTICLGFKYWIFGCYVLWIFYVTFFWFLEIRNALEVGAGYIPPDYGLFFVFGLLVLWILWMVSSLDFMDVDLFFVFGLLVLWILWIVSSLDFMDVDLFLLFEWLVLWIGC
ncbi:unnamed protein product [Meloidogyne enterolobii]|uniref:Uncharacterized protein n=1 Tax=Meloidogyne enterolobii TaxID=390850 RepID=A0ACB0YDH3_MELEN